MTSLYGRRVLLVLVFVAVAVAITGLSLRADPPCGDGTVPKSSDCPPEPFVSPDGVQPSPNFYTASCQRTSITTCGFGFEWQPYQPATACGPMPPTTDPNAGLLTKCGPAQAAFCSLAGGVPICLLVNIYGVCGKQTECEAVTVRVRNPDGTFTVIQRCTAGRSWDVSTHSVVNGNACLIPVCICGVF